MAVTIIGIVFALLVASCSHNSGHKASFEMIGLAPGSDVTELNFNWYSDTAEFNKKSFVRIADSNGKTVSVFSGIAGAASERKFYHKATVKGLAANTKYKYSLSNDSLNWSEAHDYNSPAEGKFKFAVVGDPQLFDSATAKNWEITVGKITEANANFIVSCGDQTDSFTANEAEYAFLFAPSALRNIPFAAVMGNHDTYEFFTYHFNLPNQSQGAPDKQSNYFYLYNNVLFIGLNTAPYPKSVEEAAPYITVFDSTITAAKAANNGKYKWIVVYHHKSTRSTAVHFADADIKYYVEAGFEELMTKHGVNLVLSGHDHIHTRSEDSNGAVYLGLTTASGLKFYPYDANSHPAGMIFYSEKQVPEYTIVDVSDTDMAIKTYGIDGSIVDEFTLKPMSF